MRTEGFTNAHALLVASWVPPPLSLHTVFEPHAAWRLPVRLLLTSCVLVWGVGVVSGEAVEAHLLADSREQQHRMPTGGQLLPLSCIRMPRKSNTSDPL